MGKKQKVLVACRGDIAVRVIRTCKDMGFYSVALYEPEDIGSLHVRIADECIKLPKRMLYLDWMKYIEIAKQLGVTAIHPGYSYLAANFEFAQACEQAGLTFIGSPAKLLGLLEDRLKILQNLRGTSIEIPPISNQSFQPGELDGINRSAEEIGYPLVLHARRHRPGRNLWFIEHSNQVQEVINRAHEEIGENSFFIQKLVKPAQLIRILVFGDHFGNIIRLGEVDSSIQFHNRKLIEESPSPNIDIQTREIIFNAATWIAKSLEFVGLGTIEFLVNEEKRVFFVKIKPYIPVGHALFEQITGLDLVEIQLRIISREQLNLTQENIDLRLCSIQCRISALDPANNFLPSPGSIKVVRFPEGPWVRVDSHIFSNCEIPQQYDPLLAKITILGRTRDECIFRMRRALSEFQIVGIPTDISLSGYVLSQAGFIEGNYNTDFLSKQQKPDLDDIYTQGQNNLYRDLAIAAALSFVRRKATFKPIVPDRFMTNWHRESRKPG